MVVYCGCLLWCTYLIASGCLLWCTYGIASGCLLWLSTVVYVSYSQWLSTVVYVWYSQQSSPGSQWMWCTVCPKHNSNYNPRPGTLWHVTYTTARTTVLTCTNASLESRLCPCAAGAEIPTERKFVDITLPPLVCLCSNTQQGRGFSEDVWS